MAGEQCFTFEEIKKFKVTELRTRLSGLGLQTSGLKADLVARLSSYYESQTTDEEIGEQVLRHNRKRSETSSETLQADERKDAPQENVATEGSAPSEVEMELKPETIQPSVPVYQGTPVPPAEAIIKHGTIQPDELVQSVELVSEPVHHKESALPVHLALLAQAVQEGEPIQLDEPIEVDEPTELIQPVEAVQGCKQVDLAPASEPDQLAEQIPGGVPVGMDREVQPVERVTLEDNVPMEETVMPVEPAQSVEVMQSGEPAQLPVDEPVQMDDTVQPVGLSMTEAVQPVEPPADEPVQPIEIPVDEPAQLVQVLADEPVQPVQLPTDEPVQLPTDEPVQPDKLPRDEPVQLPVDAPVQLPVDAPVQPDEVPVHEPVQPDELPVREPVQPAELQVDEPVQPVKLSMNELVQPVELPASEPIQQVEVPVGEAVQPVELPVDELVQPVQLPEGKPVQRVELPANEPVQPVELQVDEAVQPVQLPGDEPVQPVELPVDEPVQPVHLLADQPVQSVQLPVDETVEPVEPVPEREASQPTFHDEQTKASSEDTVPFSTVLSGVPKDTLPLPRTEVTLATEYDQSKPSEDVLPSVSQIPSQVAAAEESNVAAQRGLDSGALTAPVQDLPPSASKEPESVSKARLDVMNHLPLIPPDLNQGEQDDLVAVKESRQVTQEQEKKKKKKKKRRKKRHTEPVKSREDVSRDEEVELEYVPETLELDARDPVYAQFAHIFETFKLTETPEVANKDETKDKKNEQTAEAPKKDTNENDTDTDSEEDDETEKQEVKTGDNVEKLSKKKLKLKNRMSVAELKQFAPRPDVVEMHDVTAPDPKLLVYLKSCRNTVPVPRHWCFKRKYLQGKRGIIKPPFQLPEFIQKTGIMEMREALQEKEDAKNMKAKMREKVRPKMGKIDIDYQKLHDAFFKWQTKPKMTIHGDLYYEGKEFETKLKEKKPGDLSDELRTALGMPTGAGKHLVPPPWLIAMQRYGPPPSYPNLKIPGLNAPIPEGASFGYHAGGWGKPPVDEQGRPLYGDVFGTQQTDVNLGGDEHVDTTLWGELESESEESEESEEESEEEPQDQSGLITPAETGLVTPSGLTSIPAGMETPDMIELRKRKNIEEAMESGSEQPTLYTVLPEKRVGVGAMMMGSSHVYDLATAAPAGTKKTTGGLTEGVEVALDPSELELDPAAMQARYDEQLREQQNIQKEDFSDMVAEHAARQQKKRKKTTDSGKAAKKYKEFKF